MKFNIIIVLAALIFFTSCEKTIELDVRQTESKIVIEGQVTNITGYNYVKVTRSTGFYSTGIAPRVTNATVQVENDLGEVVNFLPYTGSHADSAGYYFPEPGFAGEVGRTYTLSVVVDGQTYKAEDTLYPLVDMEKIDYRINENEQDDPEVEGRFYELLLYVKEPKDTKDYYLFKCFRNDSLTYANETDIYFADDELIGENIDGIPLPVFYGVNDLARLEVYSLSRDAFIFYRDLQKLLTNDGGMFGTPPANPRSNFSNGALGLFQTSAVRMAELRIDD